MIEHAIVVGASGYLGRRLLDALGSRGTGTYNSRPRDGMIRFDASSQALEVILKQVGKPITHVFVPYGAIDPDRCAREPAATMETNIVSIVRLIDAATKAGATPVFFSTDYVFEGSRGDYRESDCPGPTTSYGAQKLAVEQWMRTINKPWLIARMSKVVGPETDTHSVIGQWINDIKAGKPQRAATDQVFSPAWADDIARALVDLCDKDATGIYHVAGWEHISRYDLLSLLLEETQRIAPAVRIEITPCKLNDLPFAEKRPLNTWLNVDKLKSALDWRFKTMREVCADAASRHF